MSRKQVNMEPASSKKNQYREGVDLESPTRRTLEGHTSPCEECFAVDWNMDENRGEIVCNSCGLVAAENVIDPGAEWINGDSGQDKSRVGAPLTYTLADRGLNTTIDVKDLNSGTSGRLGMSNQARRDWRRRRVVDERSKTRKSRERNLVRANQFIRDKSGLPRPLQEEVARIYRKLSTEGFVTGRSIAGVSAACTYLVARQESLPRQISHIAESFDVTEKELSRLIRQVSRKMNMHKITSPDQFFDKFISDLQLPANIHIQVNNLWQIIKPHDDIWQGKKPMGVAAALIYKASNESSNPRTQSEVCAVANISEVTLRGLLRLFDGLLQQLGHESLQ